MYEEIVKKLTEAERTMWLLGLNTDEGKAARDRALRLRSTLADTRIQQAGIGAWNRGIYLVIRGGRS